MSITTDMPRNRQVALGGALCCVALLAPASTALASVKAWVADPAGPRILRVNTASGLTRSISTGGDLVQPRGVALTAGGDILVADGGGPLSQGAILRIDRNTGAQTVISRDGAFQDPSGVLELPGGEMLVTDSAAGALFRVDAASGAQTLVASGVNLVAPSAVALADDGSYLVADPAGPTPKGAVVRVDPASGAQTIVTGDGSFDEPTQIAVDGNNRIFVADPQSGGGSVLRVSVPEADQSVLSTGGLFADPTGIALEPSGSLLVADSASFGLQGALLRLDAATGAQSVLSSSLLLSTPVAVAVEPDGDLDGEADFGDNCPATPNALQSDADADGIGDACDPTPGLLPPFSADGGGANGTGANGTGANGTGANGTGGSTRLPEPKHGKSVNLTGRRGEVKVTLPATADERALVTEAQIPVGTTVDVTEGSVVVKAADAPDGSRQSARFSGGRFKLVQNASRPGETVLRLIGPAPACADQATSSARRKRNRRLWGSGHGRFRVRGRNAAAVVRGTKWLVEDRCAGTLVKVMRGKVAVRDSVKRKTVMIGRGEQYFARRSD